MVAVMRRPAQIQTGNAAAAQYRRRPRRSRLYGGPCLPPPRHKIDLGRAASLPRLLGMLDQVRRLLANLLERNKRRFARHAVDAALAEIPQPTAIGRPALALAQRAGPHAGGRLTAPLGVREQ